MADPRNDEAPGPRAVFFDEDSAREAARLLSMQGWSAELSRERYHGEDDDEDHPWAVVSDAPLLVLELLVDQNEGWLDIEHDDPTIVPGIAPAPLPDAPKRVKRPDLGDGS